MEIGQTVYAGNGMAWLVEGTILNSEMIQRLLALGLENVVIREYRKVRVDIPKEETVIEPPLEFVIAPSTLQVKVDNEYEAVLTSVRRLFSILRLKRALEPTTLNQITDQILEWSSRGAFIANFLLLAAQRPDYPVQHSVHVAAISGVIGNLLEMPEQELKELVLCGLVHDIGFLPDSNETLLGSSQPDQMENAKSHPVKGFKILQACSFIPQSVLYGVLQHHERCDGSGYPLGVDQDKIHRFAKIIGVADTYELLNFSRDNTESLSPFLVMRRLKDEMLEKLDPVSCTAFLEYLTKGMIGNVVLLSDGAKAQVVYWYSSDPQPVVRKDNGNFIDLSKQKQVSIVKIISA
jgi:HD-GYP domain-containing protein (c-di-GMP phosphodiesterase class II)